MTDLEFTQLLERTITNTYRGIKAAKVKLYGTTLRVSIEFKWWSRGRKAILKEIRHDLTGAFGMVNLPIHTIEMPHKGINNHYHILKSPTHELATH